MVGRGVLGGFTDASRVIARGDYGVALVRAVMMRKVLICVRGSWQGDT